MAMQVAIKAAVAKAGASAAISADAASIEQAAGDSIRAMLLIRTYRVRGHLAAELDPLGLAKRALPADGQSSRCEHHRAASTLLPQCAPL